MAAAGEARAVCYEWRQRGKGWVKWMREFPASTFWHKGEADLKSINSPSAGKNQTVIGLSGFAQGVISVYDDTDMINTWCDGRGDSKRLISIPNIMRGQHITESPEINITSGNVIIG